MNDFAAIAVVCDPSPTLYVVLPAPFKEIDLRTARRSYKNVIHRRTWIGRERLRVSAQRKTQEEAVQQLPRQPLSGNLFDQVVGSDSLAKTTD